MNKWWLRTLIGSSVFCSAMAAITEIAFAVETESHKVASPSWFYYLQWAILLLILFLVVSYMLRLFRLGKPAQTKTGLSFFLVVLVFIYFFLGYPSSVADYHESLGLAVIRLLLMTFSGILVIVYGFLGKPEGTGY